MSNDLPEFEPQDREPSDVNFYLRIRRSLRERVVAIREQARSSGHLGQVREVNRYLEEALAAAIAKIEEKIQPQ